MDGGVRQEERYLRPTALTQGPVSVEVWVAAARPTRGILSADRAPGVEGDPHVDGSQLSAWLWPPVRSALPWIGRSNVA
jgi:hypothetical protein